MNKSDKLDKMADKYMIIVRDLITSNKKRSKALSDIMDYSFFGDYLPGREFSMIPESCAPSFKLLLKWKQKVYEKIEKKHFEIDKKDLDTNLKQREKNFVDSKYIISNMHMSKNVYEVIDSILYIGMELKRLSYLDSDTRNKIKYVEIK